MLEKTKARLQQGTHFNIVALGDSLTDGWMVSKGFLDFLEENLKKKYPSCSFTIFNRGIPGDTAKGGLYRLSGDVIEMNPDLVFVQFALNDAFSGYTAEQFGALIDEIVERIANDTEAEILLITSVFANSPDLDAIVDRFYGELISVGHQRGLAVALVHEYWKKKVQDGIAFKKLVQADGVHPTVEGYRLMAEAIMELF